jgi:hypothetical protein
MVLSYIMNVTTLARRADVTGVGAWEPSCRGLGIAKILKKLQLHPCQGCHPVDVGKVANCEGPIA